MWSLKSSVVLHQVSRFVVIEDLETWCKITEIATIFVAHAVFLGNMQNEIWALIKYSY